MSNILLNSKSYEEIILLELNKKNSLSFVYITFTLTIFSCILVTLNFTYNDEMIHLSNLLSVIILFIIGAVFILNSLLEKKYERTNYNTFEVIGGLTASVVLFFGSLGFFINFIIYKNIKNFFYLYFIILVIFSGIYLILSIIYLVKYLKNSTAKKI